MDIFSNKNISLHFRKHLLCMDYFYDGCAFKASLFNVITKLGRARYYL